MNERSIKSGDHEIVHRYLWGAVVICVLILINLFGMKLLADEQQRYAILNKLCSQQRILILDASQLADDVLTSLTEEQPNYYLIQNLQKELGLMTRELVKTHQNIIQLADKNYALFLPEINLRSYYYDEPYLLDEHVNGFVAKLQLLASHDPKTMKRRDSMK